MPTIGSLFGLNTPLPANNLTDGYACTVKMGIEVELENFGGQIPASVTSLWNAIPDHSLRNNGIEFVLGQPKQGAALDRAIYALGEYLPRRNFSLTHRCSVHCHIDFRSATPEVLEKFFLLYMLLEPSLYTVSSKDRYSNIYCPGLSHTTAALQQASVYLNMRDPRRLAANWNKYSGINFACLQNLGSVEIRTHRGTTDPEELRNWARILNHMFHAANVLSKSEINKVSSPEELVGMVFGSQDLRDTILCDNLYRFWDNVCLNREYYNLVPQILASVPDDRNRNEISYVGIDYERLNAIINENR